MEAKKRKLDFKGWCAKILDQIKMSGPGILGVMRNWHYILTWIIASSIFAYLLTFFKDGVGKSTLIFSSLGLKDKLWVILSGFSDMIYNFTSLFGWFIILASILQGLAIALLAFNYRHKQEDLSAEASASGFGVLFSFLALGCPSCGVTMFTPLVLTVLGAGALPIINVLGGIFMVLVFILLGYAVIKLGSLAYITITAKKYKEKHEKSA